MKTTIQYIEDELAGLYPASEIEGFKRIILEEVCGWDFTAQVLRRNEKIDEISFEKIREIVRRLKKFEPVQYIIGKTWFCGLKLYVNPSVLIPRPETEELADWIIRKNSVVNGAILDVGTGSGCIALALKAGMKNCRISGVDISAKALDVAKQNAGLNGLDVDFFCADVLNWQNYKWEKYDIIVSNPPYIRESEKEQMHANVLNHEPENALFVPDHDPLVFYRSIAFFAKRNLKKNGSLFFEIHENLSAEITELLAGFGFRDTEVKKDINGKNRMTFCRNVI